MSIRRRRLMGKKTKDGKVLTTDEDFVIALLKKRASPPYTAQPLALAPTSASATRRATHCWKKPASACSGLRLG